MKEANIIVEVNLEDENVGGLAYQSYSWCNVNDFSLLCLFKFSSASTHIL